MQSISVVFDVIISTTFSTTIPALANNWVYMGTASTGEAIYVSGDGIYWDDGGWFMYSIGNEVIYAKAFCESNQWLAEGYNQYYRPQSEATQSMLDYLCSVAGQ